MSRNEGTPARSDRSARNAIDYPIEHTAEVEDNEYYIHVPPMTTGQVPQRQSDGTLAGIDISSSGTDSNAIHKNVAAEISTITEKTTPVAADLILIEDSADDDNKKRVQIGNLPGGSGGGGHVIEDNGTPMTARANLNIIGATVEDDAGGDATKVTITGGGSQSDLRRIAHGMFLMTAHTNATPEKCYTMSSIDGVTWQTFGSSPAITDTLRDPAILHWDSKWWIAATAGGGLNATAYWYLYSSSDLVTWSTTIQVSTNGVSPAATWAPHWFVDNDGSVHIFVGLKVGGYFQVYEMHPTDRAMTTWSTPVAVSGTDWPTNAIDPCVVRVGDTYYMFVKDDGTGYICLASSTSLTSGWTVTKTGDWAGWYSGLSGSIEGPTIIQMDNGTWRLYFTNNSGLSANNVYYSETTDPAFATGWSSAVSLSTLSGYNHPVPMRALGSFDLRDQILALIGKAGGIAHLNADGYVPPAQLGSGTPSGSKYLRDDSTWQIVTSGTTDSAAVHTNTANEISTLTEKTTPASTDLLIIEDSAASGVKKKVQIANLPSSSGSGNVTGPASAIQGHPAVFADTTGKVIADGGIGAFPDEAARTTPTTSTFSVTRSGNSGAGTITNLSNGLGIRIASTIPSGNTNSLTYAVVGVTVGTNGWQCTVRLRRHVPLWSWGMFGMIMRDSASGKSVTYALGNDSIVGFNRNQFSTDDAWGGVASMNASWQSLNWWMRIKDDKTNWMLYLSMDGNFWTEVYREARNGYLGTVPTHVGIAINPNFNGGTDASCRIGTPVAMDCFSFLFEQL
jgi:sucrose-6-phosphate hydrolase SacC (GH32 family)